MEYVRSEHVQLTNQAPPSSINQTTVQRLRSNSSVDEETRQFFNLVSEGDLNAVNQLLENTRMEKTSLQSRLCHPLCDCEKCTALLDK